MTEDKLKQMEDFLADLEKRFQHLDHVAATCADREDRNDAISRAFELCHWIYKLKQILGEKQ
jgi:hypothetical protein